MGGYTLMATELNKLYHSDCRDFLSGCNGKAIDLVVTSPPYNVGIEYETHQDEMRYDEYIQLLNQTFRLCCVRMAPSSVICVNIGKDYKINIPAHISGLLERVGFKFFIKIIWRKPIGSANQTALLQPGFPMYLPYLVTEDILIYYKGDKIKYVTTNDNVMFWRDRFRSNVWDIQPEFSIHHPAIMPKLLAFLLTLFFSNEEDLVFDPFAGIGTTLIVAKENRRLYLGTEISEKYIEIANNQLYQQLLI